MRKMIFSLVMFLVVGNGQAFAQGRQVLASPSPTVFIATDSAVIATPSATPVVEPRNDLTEPNGEVQGRLERYLVDQQLNQVGPTNFIRHAIRQAVTNGVAANTLVLLLLFPLVAMIVAAARHIIGLRGFGIYIPAVLSIAFIATGFIAGIVLFLIILGIGLYGMKLLKRLNMQYLPRMSLLIWLVSLGVFATVVAAPLVGFEEMMSLNIFPLLILILLAENFIEVQLGKSKQEAVELTVETIVLALISALVLSLEIVQRLAILHPELLILSIAVINIVVGKYGGLRLTEYLKFKKILD